LHNIEITATRALLWSALTETTLSEHAAQRTILEIAAPNPALFFDIGISVLESQPDSPRRPKSYARLMECREFLKELIRIGRYSDTEFQRLCSAWIKIDGFLDVRLARLLPGRHEDQAGLAPQLVGRVLEVLHHISAGPRLIHMVNHLKHHPHRLVAEKATLLVGRRIRNPGWVKQRLESTDARIRAAAVEGLWGSDTPSARMLLRQSGSDENSRVVANALMGLHLLGEIGAHQSVKEMACDERPSFRLSAVWAMRHMAEPVFLEPLRAALADSEAGVRLGAKQALVAIRKLAKEPLPAPAAGTKAAPPAGAETEEAKAFGFKFDGS
jgi:hypothetical protein